MDAMSLSSSITEELIKRLGEDYPQFKFRKGAQEHWSPKTNTITFNPNRSMDQICYGILHELAHAILDHSTYESDFELLKLEAEAWEMAVNIGKKYDIEINESHMQQCLDTYRDWLHKRSTCPTCTTHVLQRDANNYRCFNCQTIWQVSAKRFVRPYRLRLRID